MELYKSSKENVYYLIKKIKYLFYSPVLENLDLILADISHDAHLKVKEYLEGLEEEELGKGKN